MGHIAFQRYDVTHYSIVIQRFYRAVSFPHPILQYLGFIIVYRTTGGLRVQSEACMGPHMIPGLQMTHDPQLGSQMNHDQTNTGWYGWWNGVDRELARTVILFIEPVLNAIKHIMHYFRMELRYIKILYYCCYYIISFFPIMLSNEF